MRGLRLGLVLLALAAAVATPATAAAGPLDDGLARASAAYASWAASVRANVGGLRAQVVQTRLLERKLVLARATVAGVRPASASERAAKEAVDATIAAGVAVAHDALALQSAAKAFQAQGDKPEILRRGGSAAAALRRDAMRFLDLSAHARRILRGGRG